RPFDRIDTDLTGRTNAVGGVAGRDTGGPRVAVAERAQRAVVARVAGGALAHGRAAVVRAAARRLAAQGGLGAGRPARAVIVVVLVAARAAFAQHPFGRLITLAGVAVGRRDAGAVRPADVRGLGAVDGDALAAAADLLIPRRAAGAGGVFEPLRAHAGGAVGPCDAFLTRRAHVDPAAQVSGERRLAPRCQKPDRERDRHRERRGAKRALHHGTSPIHASAAPATGRGSSIGNIDREAQSMSTRVLTERAGNAPKEDNARSSQLSRSCRSEEHT